jgi:hypothetical protein
MLGGTVAFFGIGARCTAEAPAKQAPVDPPIVAETQVAPTPAVIDAPAPMASARPGHREAAAKPSAPRFAGVRQQVPEDDDRRRATQLAREAFEKEFTAATNDRDALIRSLLAAAYDTVKPAGPATRYALIHIAIEQAERAVRYAITNEQDPAELERRCGRMMSLVDLLATEFAIDAPDMQVDLLTKVLPPRPPGQRGARESPTLLATIHGQALEVAGRAADDDAFPAAKSAAGVATDAASRMIEAGRRNRDKEAVVDGKSRQEQARVMMDRIEARAASLDAYVRAGEILADMPDNAAAGGVVGKRLCFVRGDWHAGLPYLARSDLAGLATVATLERKAFAAAPRNTADVLAVADRWWSIGEREPPEERSEIRRHAALLYASVAESLADPLEAKVAATRAAEKWPGRPRMREFCDRLLTVEGNTWDESTWRSLARMRDRSYYDGNGRKPFEPLPRTPRLAAAKAAFGEQEVLLLHASDRKTPAVLRFDRFTANATGRLWISLRNSPGGDTMVTVDVAGRKMFDETLQDDKWHVLFVPFDHQDVLIRSTPNGWMHEGCFLTYQIE